MRIHGIIIRLTLSVVCGGFLTGCGGVNATGRVSPATFFMPGIMKADPQPKDQSPKAASVSAPAVELALAR